MSKLNMPFPPWRHRLLFPDEMFPKEKSKAGSRNQQSNAQHLEDNFIISWGQISYRNYYKKDRDHFKSIRFTIIRRKRSLGSTPFVIFSSSLPMTIIVSLMLNLTFFIAEILTLSAFNLLGIYAKTRFKKK